jgi:aspartyl aminopeptidase
MGAMTGASPPATTPDAAPDTNPVASRLLEDLRLSPTPYHAVQRATELLDGAGFEAIDTTQPLPAEPGGRYLTRGGTLVAWWQPAEPRGYLLVGAHTDSPNLRVRTKPDVSSAGYAQIGMEVYGGVLLNSWLDRDLGLAGRVAVGDGSGGVVERLYCDAEPIMRIPQLAIHLDREIRERGLQLDPQQHLTPLWATGEAAGGDLRGHVAAGLGVEAEQILAWDLMAFDTQPPAVVGRDRNLLASARIDNLVSAFCGLRALLEVTGPLATGGDHPARTPVLVLYDHEEIGSQSANGAAGSFLSAVLERIALAAGGDRAAYLASLARSLVVSTDGAHATHPNYVDRHEPSHLIELNAGVVVKRNANQRYATDATSEAYLVAACGEAGVPLQYYIHRNDLPCGSTIGPVTAARLGVPTVDIGAPQLAMHSARETAGVADLGHLHNALVACWLRG